MITDSLQRHPFLRLLMPLVGGIVYGDKYPYILSVGWWIAVILLLIGTYILGRKYYVLCKLYGAVVFLACFVLGWTLVSVQLKQAEYIFPNTEKPSTYRITLTTKPEIKKNSILFRVALRGEVIIRKSKFPQNPKRSVRFSGKRTKRSVQKRKARNTQKAETKVL